MSSLIAPCGLDCATCPLFTATLEPDAAKQQMMRIDIAKTCREQYSMNVAPEDITDCDGCIAGGRLFRFCVNCGIKNCVAKRELDSCAYCNDYCCDMLGKHLEMDPSGKARLESIRAGE